MVMPLFNTAPAYRMPIFNPLPIYRPPILSGLTYTGLPHPLTTVLPSYSGPSPSFNQLLPTTVSGGGGLSKAVEAGVMGGIGSGLGFLAPPTVPAQICAGVGIGIATYVGTSLWHDWTHPSPGPKLPPTPQYDMHGRLEPTSLQQLMAQRGRF